MNLLIARHGQTDWNIARRYQGHSDTILNDVGIRQAKQLAKRLSIETIHAVYCSDLSRSIDTAELIADHHKLEVRPDARWRELSFGDWEGMTYEEMSADSPKLFEAWMLDALNVPTPNGETHKQLAERVQPAFEELKEHHKDETVLLVAHSGPLQTLITLALGMDLIRHWQFHISQASLSKLVVYDSGIVLELLNDTSHLSVLGE